MQIEMTTKKNDDQEVIDLLLSDEDDENENENRFENDKPTSRRLPRVDIRNAKNETPKNGMAKADDDNASKDFLKWNAKKKSSSKKVGTTTASMVKTTTSQGLQAGLVLEEDIFAAFPEDTNEPNGFTSLFEDPDFGPVASSIRGMHKASIADGATTSGTTKGAVEAWRPKCRCSLGAALSLKDDGRPYFRCGKKTGKRCQYFEWAFTAELVPWYRFGSHNHHVLVRASTLASANQTSIFSAQDLVQGKVGDCWFLSALAVVAERPDLVERLFRKRPGYSDPDEERRGKVRINLFLDGIWTPIVLDNYLPCSFGGSQKEEEELQKAIEASLMPTIKNPYAKPPKKKAPTYRDYPPPASGMDPHGLSANNLRAMKATTDYLERHQSSLLRPVLLPPGRLPETTDLAYSKTRRSQLWVPFLEKAYAKIHGSYNAISGGHIAEAFLDLTGAPTLQIGWHSRATTSTTLYYQDPRRLWADLKKWRSQKLPMGCGTDRSAVGLIGMHAYSILDVREITNVGVEFFKDRLLAGTLGNVSGFTEYDGTLRLLRVRNPHGNGEWKGEFSDKCQNWERLLEHMNNSNGGENIQNLPRTMANDGTFWIGYDDFLLGFSNIDVVLAHTGNHAKSFVSNFPPKTSNHRCQRAFEVSLLDPQPGLETKERVEVYVMGIQKSRRGAKQGRADRKKSYKVSDFGILVGNLPLDAEDSSSFSTVHGQLFGFQRNGHYRLVLDRQTCKRLIVMPISFGHPVAADEFLSFVVRFTADAPLMIRELPSVPRMDKALGDFLIQPKPHGHRDSTNQGQKTVLWRNHDCKVVRIDCRGNGGGTVFVYVCSAPNQPSSSAALSLNIEATCRGMSCRVEGRLLDHETISKGKKFEASWRKFRSTFRIEAGQSRLLMVLYQSGQDTEMGSITCDLGQRLGSNSDLVKPVASSTTLDKYWKAKSSSDNPEDDDAEYKERGVFHPVAMDANSFEHCGSSLERLDTTVLPNGGGSEDQDLETVLALSRQEHPLPIVEDSSTLEDAMLQEALQRSAEEQQQQQQQQHTNTIIDMGDAKMPYDKDLESALRKSRQEADSGGGINKDNILDLVEEHEAIDLTANSKKPTAVLDLTIDSSPQSRSKRFHPKDDNINGGPIAAAKNSENGENNILDLVDSSDDEDGTKSKNPLAPEANKKKIDEQQQLSGSSENTTADSREKKRKLVAEAAMKRMQKFR